MDVWIVSALLIATLYLLITETLPVDLTALGIIVALLVSGILTPAEAVAGFANPAVITVGAMFLISRAMVRTGAVSFLGQQVIAGSRGSAKLAMLIILVIVALASAFINNTPVVVLFIPVVMQMCCRFGLSPSKFLIPISYASILAGTCTLIGTSTNIIVSDLSVAYGYGALGMFEVSVVGVPIAVIGLVMIFFGAPRLMPELLNPSCELDDSDHRRYLAELAIPKTSKLVGTNPCQSMAERYPRIETLELIRDGHILHPCRDRVTVAADDLLLVKGAPDDLVAMLHDKTVELPRSEKDLRFGGSEETVVVEMIIPPQSSLLDQRLRQTALMREPGLHMVAIKRSGLHYTEKQVQDIRLKIGDILLVWLPAANLERLRGRSDYIMVEDVHHAIVHKRKAKIAAVIFAGLVAAAATGLANIMICALAGAFLMIATGCLQIRDAYRTLQANVLMLIAGTIALGTAMDKTGTSRLYADAFLRLLDGWPPWAILGGFILLTSISTQLLSNNATAVLLLPIAVSTALGLGVAPKPFIIAVCLGASACFATPIGYQTNLLVYGPGGYRFSDYFKLGMPLNLMVIGLGTALIPVFWPF